jgi:Mn-dependent DtxR family transcriptional regulator
MKDNNQTKQRKERSDKGKIILTERDLFGLHWTAEQYGIRIDQLQQLLGRVARKDTKEERRISEPTVKDLVNRWQRAELVKVEKFFYKQPRWVWLTHAGLERLGLPYKVWEASVSALNHVYWVNVVRLYIEATHTMANWKPERELRFEKGKEGHTPDAEVELGGFTYAIEVELTRKKITRLVPIMRTLASNKDYRAIQYFTTSETEGVVRNGAAQLPEPLSKKIIVDRLEDKL